MLLPRAVLIYNPAGDLRGALPPVKGKHFASVTEPEQVGEVLRALDGYEGTLPVRCALAPCTTGVSYARVSFATHSGKISIWTMQNGAFWSPKQKPSTLCLSPNKLSRSLQELKPLTGRGRYVFPSARNPKGDQAYER